MSRLFRLGQCMIGIIAWNLLLTATAVAQPTLISERRANYRFDANIAKSFELPGHRFAHCGHALLTIQNRTKDELTLVVSTAAGDTVRYRRLNRNPLGGGDLFTDAVLEPDYSITYLSQNSVPGATPTDLDERSYSLTQIDTLGRVRWQRFYALYPVGTVLFANALLRVPDGYLILVNPVATAASTPNTTYTHGGLAKVDRQGNPLWQRTWPSRGYGGVGNLGSLVARPDGSYLATGYSDNGTPYTGGAALPRFDHWLVQFTPQGDTIRTARFGVSPEFETGYYVYNTRDGGAVVSGARRTTSSSYNDAQLVKLDSLLRPQWTYTQPNVTGYSDYFLLAQPTRRGDVVFGSNVYNRATNQAYGYLKSYTASGVERWTFSHNFGGTRPTGFAAGLLLADSSAYLAGGTAPVLFGGVSDRAFFHFGNVGAPFVADLCRVPPQANFGFARSASGDSLRVVDFSLPGPRYAALALWHWDFGDGTSAEGPTPPPHRYATAPGAGLRVSLTVTNNLGCTNMQLVFPFALATAAQRRLQAGAQLWPSPTAGAATLQVPGLRPQPPVLLQVLNALGQVVQARAVPVRQGLLRAELDLTGLPPGIYAVRLLAQEGSIVKRLVRE